VVRLRLDRGADPNERQERGYVALQTAATHGDIEMAATLIEHGAPTAWDRGRAEQQRDPGTEGKRRAFIAQAAAPDSGRRGV